MHHTYMYQGQRSKAKDTCIIHVSMIHAYTQHQSQGLGNIDKCIINACIRARIMHHTYVGINDARINDAHINGARINDACINDVRINDAHINDAHQ